MNSRTLLIGLDGATFTVLDELMQDGVMPFLRSFMESGVRADLRTIVPPLTPPAWTSLMTGVTPGNHGVFDFFRMEPDESRHIRFFNSNDIGCDTIWTLADRYGKRTTVLNFPAMFPAPRIRGVVVPGWIPWKQLRLACWPQGLFDELKQLPWFSPHELAMDNKLEEKATEGCSDPADYVPWIELHTRREENWLRVFEYLHSREPADLSAVLFDGVDKLQHLCWRFIHPQDAAPLTEEWEFEVRAACLGYFRRLDSILERICVLAGTEANVIIASDHGFGPTEMVFHINSWLEQNGYLAWSDEAKRTQQDQPLLGVGQVARHTFLMDWSRTQAFAATPTSNGIYITRANDYEALRSELVEKLKQVPNPDTGEPAVAQVWTREEAFGGAWMHVAPDITVGMADGGIVSIMPNSDILTRRPAVAGAHRPVGVFAARGPAICGGAASGELSILDVPVLALHTLGVPPEAHMQGALPQHILSREVLSREGMQRPAALPAAAATGGGVVKPVPAPSYTPMDEQIIMDRLRELGYVE